MLRSELCDYSDAYIVVERTIDLLATAANENHKVVKDVAFKNSSPFRSCISKINSTLIDNGEDLDIVMPMYSLLEYVNDNARDGKQFEYKTKIVGNTPERPGNE